MKFAVQFKKNKSGFSLIELMIVVGIIGVLASLAVPRLTVFMAKARQSEAKTSLSSMHMLQETYSAENGSYAADASQVGWVPPEKARYTITTTTINRGRAESGTTGETAICKNQSGADVWTMNVDRVITNWASLGTICPK